MKAITTVSVQPARFAVGHKVAQSAFVDCFGKQQPRVDGLTVERVTLVSPEYPGPHAMPPYYRILAVKEGHRIDAAERFFELSSERYPANPLGWHELNP